MGAHRLLSPPLLSPCLPDLSVMLVCSPVPTRNLQHTPTHTHPYSTHTPTHAHHDQYTRVYAVRADGAHACTSMCSHAHKHLGWCCSHTQAQCGLHARGNEDTLSSASRTHPGLLWSSHPSTNAHSVSAVAPTRMHTHTQTLSPGFSRTHTRAHPPLTPTRGKGGAGMDVPPHLPPRRSHGDGLRQHLCGRRRAAPGRPLPPPGPAAGPPAWAGRCASGGRRARPGAE